MGYLRAEKILPPEIVTLIQQYIDGENIYIPRKESNKREWGNGTLIREELKKRNRSIFSDFNLGLSNLALSEKYFLSEKSIQRIIREMKKITFCDEPVL